MIPGRAPQLPWFSRGFLIARVHPDATVLLRRLAIGAARGQRHEDMVVIRVSRHAVSVAVRRNVLEPLPGSRINHAEHRARGHVSRRQIVAVIAGIVPSLVDGADVVNRSEDRAIGAINDDARRSERAAIMIGATHQYIRARAGTDTGGHAAQYRKTVDYGRASGAEGIDFVNAPDNDVKS